MTPSAVGTPERGKARRFGSRQAQPKVSRDTINHRRLQASATGCRIGQYGLGWRHGFRSGAADALRLASRRTEDPDVWVMLSTLADAYALAGSDD
jgi:hypothetical protein